MKTLLHFAKIFGLVWGVLTILYLIALFRGMNFVWASYGTTRPSPRVMQAILFFWPVAPALIIASFWEVVRAIRFRVVR